MLKTSLLVVAGLVAGFAIAYWLQPSSPPPMEPVTFGAPSAVQPVRAVTAAADASGARLAALEAAFEAETEQRAALEARVEELAAQLEALGPRTARGGASAPEGAPDQVPTAEMRERFRRDAQAQGANAEQRFIERLVAEGFAWDRAEWISRRTEELRMQALQAQYDAQRGGRPVSPVAGEQSLRAELGEADYERYLRADGRPTAIPVRDVLASSPAERSGLQPGDEIVGYAGQRVFDMRELNALTLEGTPGESVIVEVRREGQLVQLVMPRGPIGITGGGFRRR